ncbi:hypothetical protein [Wenyingzhuangia sp. IMCC45574]
MKNFLVIYYSTPENMAAFAALSPEETQTAMQAWDVWKQTFGDAITDLGAPLMPPTSVGNTTPENLPSQLISGYSMVQADSLEEAKTLFKEHPYKENGIHIFECIDL